ncbi:hypothetical protein LTR91_017296 [Friedmanniomyces endolithicus]|uniref:Uncharacterized protein n=1 Tax=Friedmanniomyces endolithicus TaxID=329885 RepID=A0AAN6K6D6_9PEZI|nr:hypothetical protein LTS09_010385 [Friedmanniomyces endolithicus]KAK0366626.1 hypothetical protein LTR94_002015 [Friedmanniomyces endolithicus]KAK0771091.1 hypothetical protein LTR38_017346 [Friedmanniomyces endolithicus]KAK0798644.1 hypothetical protein LTR59_006417 [Friedmanniomyces endolithicus]KAK0821919.1 hypothetical protein LTR75_000052 [Friedmanniomyces endolithicus]
MAGIEDSDYGSDLDEVMLGKVLSSCARPGLPTVAKAGKRLALPNDSEYGSEVDERDFDEGVSDYGSDIDSTTAERLLLAATPVRRRAAPPKDMQSLGNCVGQMKSPLLSLTPELRNLIYEKVFEDFTADWIPCKFYAPPSVLLTCKQTYVEAISVFYSTATFRASDFNTLDKRIRRLRYCHRRLVRSIDVDTQQQFIKRGHPLRWTEKKHWVHRSEKYAELELTRVRNLFKTGPFKELNLRSLRASIELPNGETVWSEDPTKALALYYEKNEKAPRPPRWRGGTLSRVTLSEQDLAAGMWSSTLQTFVLVILDD